MKEAREYIETFIQGDEVTLPTGTQVSKGEGKLEIITKEGRTVELCPLDSTFLTAVMAEATSFLVTEELAAELKWWFRAEEQAKGTEE